MQENIKVWVDALRSGQYQQCQDTLYNGEGYCCLGVYAKVNNLSTDEEMFREKDIFKGGYEGPERVYTEFRVILELDFMASLIEMNDRGDSFHVISDFIDNHYKKKESGLTVLPVTNWEY